MPKFLALTSRGLEDVVKSELEKLELKGLKTVPLGVEFEANWQGCYRANLWVRSATRIVMPILDFFAYQPEELYNQIQKHDFTKYIDPDQTLAVDAKARDSQTFRDSRFVAMKAKDAIVDQFREKFGRRPDVDRDDPDLRVMVRVVKSSVAVAIDTSGESLAHRGYRKHTVQAPLREHLAAGLIELSGWNNEIVLVDPMCGSGTFLIEAALIASGRAPAALRKQFGFMKLKGFQKDAWEKVQLEARKMRQKPVRLMGFDRDMSAIKAARINARMAGVESLIDFECRDFREVKRPAPKGILIVNPPYGERLGELEALKKDYHEFSSVLKREFKDWNCWLLSGSDELTAALRLKAARKYRVYNGNLDCRFLNYPIT